MCAPLPPIPATTRQISYRQSSDFPGKGRTAMTGDLTGMTDKRVTDVARYPGQRHDRRASDHVADEGRPAIPKRGGLPVEIDLSARPHPEPE